MLKSKLKFMLILLAVIALIGTASYATEISVDDILDQSTDGTEDSLVDEEYEDPDAGTTADEWVKSDLYKMEDKVVIDQVVDGNVYVMAQEVVIKSEIGGDVFVMAKKITIDGGYIYSNLYALAADEIVINGIVCDAYVCANNFTLGSDGYIYRDLRVSANNINIEGKVRRNAFMAGISYNFSEEHHPLIGGNLEYSATEEAKIPEGAVGGEVKFDLQEVKEATEDVVKTVVKDIVKNYIFDLASMLALAAVVALLASWLAPKFVERVSGMGVGKAFASFGIGVAALLVVPLAIILLIISTIGAKIAFATIFVYIAMCIASTAFASLYFGSLFAKLFKWEDKTKFVLACLLASLAIWLVSHIPFFGGFCGFILAIFGLGLLIVNTIVRKDSKNEVTIDPEK